MPGIQLRYDIASDFLQKPVGKQAQEQKLRAQISEICQRLGHNVDPISIKLFSEETLSHFELEQVQGSSTLFTKAQVIISACLAKGEKACKSFYQALHEVDKMLAEDLEGSNETSISTAGHLQATVLSKTFGETRVDLQLNEQVRREMELHNEKVKKNREILKRLIDCVIFLGKQELSFRGHDESAGSNNRGNYVEILSLIVESITDLHYHLSTNKVFSGTSGKIQNDLITAIAEVMGKEIRSDI
ncbi:ZMYM1 protein, partial [Polypterus senegalus]